MIPTAVPNIGKTEELNLLACITSTMVSTAGPFVTQFENKLADICGCPGSVSTNSGTSALHATLTYFGVGYKDLVITPSMTFIATANAIAHTGAEPWLFDVSKDNWTLDLELLSELLETQTVQKNERVYHAITGQRIAAIMPVLTMGLPIDFMRLSQIAQRYNLPVIVDAAAAVGIQPYNQKLGEMPIDAACFSFNGNKTITCGGGGAIISRSKEVLQGLKHLTTTGRVGPNYDHDIVAFNYRMTNVSAAIGVAQLERLTDFLQTKKRLAQIYANFATKVDILEKFPSANFGQSTHWFSGFYYTGSQTEYAEQFRSFMKSANIDLRQFWKPVHLQKPYNNVQRTKMDVAENLWWRIFPLPVSTNITDQEIQIVLETAQKFWLQN